MTLDIALTVGRLMLLWRCDPPRALDHFVDTVGDVLDMDSGAVVKLYDPVAAMPSTQMRRRPSARPICAGAPRDRPAQGREAAQPARLPERAESGAGEAGNIATLPRRGAP